MTRPDYDAATQNLINARMAGENPAVRQISTRSRDAAIRDSFATALRQRGLDSYGLPLPDPAGTIAADRANPSPAAAAEAEPIPSTPAELRAWDRLSTEDQADARAGGPALATWTALVEIEEAT